MMDELKNLYPFLIDEQESIINELNVRSKIITLPAEYQFLYESDKCLNLTFVLEGSARVFKYGDTGRELTLYHVEPGELCLLTAMSILNNQTIPANAITDSEVKGFVVDSRFISTWMEKSPLFRAYMFDLIYNRFSGLVELIDALTFQKVDQRILDYLKSFDSTELELTHLKIATEVGTSREVVSRILKNFELKKLIKRSRNKIKLL